MIIHNIPYEYNYSLYYCNNVAKPSIGIIYMIMKGEGQKTTQ